MAAAASARAPTPLPDHLQPQSTNHPLHALLTAANQLSHMAPSAPPPATVPPPSEAIPTTVLQKPCYTTSIVELTPPDLTTMRLPMFYPRDSSRSHVEQLKGSLMQDGIDDECGFVAYCAQQGEKHIVRGAQLLQAFCELYEKGRFRYVARDAAQAECMPKLGYIDGVWHVGMIKCAFLQRIDETDGRKVVDTPFSATETLLLAAHYNSKHGHVRPMTVLDNITLAQRFILCRLRDLNLSHHLESINIRAVPPNIVWSKLTQLIEEATVCHLIPFSTTPSAPAKQDRNSYNNNTDTPAWRQQMRAARQRQGEYIRLALSLLWSPNTHDLIMNRCNVSGTIISSSLWSLRTFRLSPFTSADDPVQFVMLLALFRIQRDRRALKLRPFDRDKTKRLLELIANCVQKLLEWTMNRKQQSFPTKWDIFNAVTTITPEPPTIHPPPPGQQTKRVTVADILMSLLTHWESTPAGSRPTPVVAADSAVSCTTDQIFFSLQCFMQRWPFNRKWRMLSSSLSCFKPDLFLQPPLSLSSIRFRPFPVRPPSTDTPVVQTVAQHAMRRETNKLAAPPPPRPTTLATVLPTIDDRVAPLASDNIPGTIPRQHTNPLVPMLPSIRTTQPVVQSTNPAVATLPPSASAAPIPSTEPVETCTAAGAAATETTLMPARTVEEEMLDSGQGDKILDTDSDDEDDRTDAYTREKGSNDSSNSTDSDVLRKSKERAFDTALSRKRKSLDEALNQSAAARKDKRKKNRKNNERRSNFLQPITNNAETTSRTNPNVVDDDTNGSDEDVSDSDEEEETLDPFYDKINAALPNPTDVRNLPIACHDLGAWKHYLTNADVQELTNLIKARCAKLYYSEIHGNDGNDERLWPAFVGHKAYCNTKNFELRSHGYTILNGLLKDSSVAEDADCVIKHFAGMWKGERRYTKNQQRNNVWKHIVNCGSHMDSRNASKGIGRYTVDVHDLVDRTIQRHPELFKRRLRVEATVGFLIDDIVQDCNTATPLKFPVTGSRLLFQTRHAKPQLPHYDFGTVKYIPGTAPWTPMDSKDLSYFAMLSGAEGFHLRIWRDGHRMMYGPFQLVSQIATTLQSEVIFIPPYSVLIVRGDLPHAGVGGEEGNGPTSSSCTDEEMHIRFHIYVARYFESLKDGVYLTRHKLKINDNKSL